MKKLRQTIGSISSWFKKLTEPKELKDFRGIKQRVLRDRAIKGNVHEGDISDFVDTHVFTTKDSAGNIFRLKVPETHRRGLDTDYYLANNERFQEVESKEDV